MTRSTPPQPPAAPPEQAAWLRRVFEYALPWALLCVLVINIYNYFFQKPYYGFFTNTSGVIVSLSEPSVFQLGDRIVQVGNVTWESYSSNSRQQLFDGVTIGGVFHIILERDGSPYEFDYTFPPPTQNEVVGRLTDVWWVPFVFWLMGTLTLLVARPKDNTWRLLIAFNYLTALWLSAGALSSQHFGNSSIWLRVVMWLAVPVYLHLHFVFPKPLWPMPKVVGWMFYGVAVLLAVVQWFGRLPNSLYQYAFLGSILGSLILLLAHYVSHRSDRERIGFLFRVMLLALVPPIVLVIYGLATGYSSLAGGSTLFLSFLPVAYFYSIYRHRLGGMEVRINRVLSIYAYLLLLGMAGLLLVPVGVALATGPNDWIIFWLVTIFGAALVTLYGFSRFQTFFEQRFLNIRVPPTKLLESYAAQITATLDIDQLITYLRDDIAASLLIRQSALMRVDEERMLPLYVSGLDPTVLPLSAAPLGPAASRYLPLQTNPNKDTGPFGGPKWVRLILPLSIENRVIGYWLLGRRDPDDFYSAQDIAVLTTLAHQTATALHNILQTQRLHALYQNDIDEREAERASLARELHDQVLNELGILWKTANPGGDPQHMDESFQRLAASVRETITGLRPAAVDFGLHLALTDLVDRVSSINPTVKIELVLQNPNGEYPRHAANVELHLYRIVQQALANALAYAKAGHITIRGDIGPEAIVLEVVDDGVGFEIGDEVDIASLLAHKHYGIAGMYERAQIIGARMRVESSVTGGTRVEVRW